MKKKDWNQIKNFKINYKKDNNKEKILQLC